jgi:hypothetical protein
MASGYSVPPEVLKALQTLGNIESDAGGGPLIDLKNILSVHFGDGAAKTPSFGGGAPQGGHYFWEAIDLEKKYDDKSKKMSYGASQLVKAIQDLAKAASDLHDAYVKAETDLAAGSAQLNVALTKDLPQVNADVAAGAQGVNGTQQQNGGQ